MIVYFGTVVRKAPVQQGGELVKLDWEKKEILARRAIIPGKPDVTKGPNKRGQARGCRGIEIIGDTITAANYHSVEIFDRGLEHIRTVSNDMMVGLHETCHVGENKIWVSSTAIDAAFLVDLDDGKVVDEYWPREDEFFQKEFDLIPLPINKDDDNRDKFLDLKFAKDNSHLHLNAVTTFGDDVYVLFNRHGVVANLTKKKVVLRNIKMKGAHNVEFIDANTVAVCGTKSGTVLIFDLNANKLLKEYDLRKFKPVKKHLFYPDLKYKVELLLRKWRIKKSVIAARPCFVRGLKKIDDYLFVGTSPAILMCFDLRTDELVDYYIHSRDTRVAVHGLNISHN